MAHEDTRQSARQLIRSLKKYQLCELAMLLAAIHEEDCIHEAANIIYDELRDADRREESSAFLETYDLMVEQH